MAVGRSYMGNVCLHCDALSDEHYVNSEPAGPYFPADPATARAITAT